MFCPNCGKDCGEFKFCPECGTQVRLLESDDTDQKEKGVFPKPPFAMKKVRQGVLEFETDRVKLNVKPPKVKRREMQIPYNEIFDVSYVPATTWLNGFLCLREWKSQHIPLPMKFSEGKKRDSIIWFEKKENVIFYRAYEFLKQCAAINAEQRQK